MKAIPLNGVFVVAVFVVLTTNPDPVVRELALTVLALVVVPVNVCTNVPVPDVIVRFWLAARVKVPFEVNPDVAVINPEIVGVAVHAVGEIVRALPAIVVAYVALPNVVAADIPWKSGEETEVPTLIAAENDGAPAFAVKTVLAAP